MKFSKITGPPATGPHRWGGSSQLFLVSSIGLLVATLFTACQLVSIDYVFLATTGGTTKCAGGQIETYAVDSQSGAVRKANPPVCSGGNTPVALAISPGYTNLYVANAADKTVVHFAVAENGVLTSKDTVTLSSAPVSLAVSSSGNALYVVSGSTSVTLTAYALTSGTIGSVTAQQALTVPGFTSDSLVPTGVTALANGSAVYVTAYDMSAYNPGGTTTSTANPGWVFGFSAGTGGTLTATAGSPYKAGVKPSGLAADPTSRFVYVTDFASNQLIGYGVYSGEVLNFLLNGPFRTGAEPSSVAIDPRGKFMYISNALDSSVSAYVIDLATGTPSSAVNPTGSSTNSTDTQPAAIAIDPALGRYVYTANFLGNSISGFRLDPTAGTLIITQSTPYPSGSKPTALVIVPHGNHSIQTVTP
jgi:6-phosphogluconolactonase